ncbi:MAG: ABC transporter ATP-binding protein [Sediminibacterium sp.]|nr:ABC transporter ATP-binding protein [Sediminibacterium sp.]
MSKLKKEKSDLKILKKLYPFIKKHPKLFWGSISLSIILAFIIPIRPYLVQLTIDLATHSIKVLPPFIKIFIPDVFEKDILAIIWSLVIIQLVILVIEFLLRVYYGIMSSKLGQSIVYDLRLVIFEKILRFPVSKFDSTPVGTLTTRTINDIVSIQEIFSEGLMSISADILNIFIVLVFMFVLDWKMTLVSLSSFPILFLATYIFKEAVKKSYQKVRLAVIKLNNFVQEQLSGIHVIQSFTREKAVYEEFKKINREHRQANVDSIFAYAIFIPLMDIVLSLSVSIMVWYVVDNSLDIGKLTAFILYLNLIFRPIRFIADKFNTLQMGLIAAERVLELLDQPVDDTMKIGNLKPALSGHIKFDNVWLAYHENNWILKNINFEVKAGEVIAIIGKTGSGKTSIVRLINRLYEFQKGHIYFDGIDLKSIDLTHLRNNISVVSQDLFLFSTTIKENILLQNHKIELEEIINIAKSLGFHEFISSLPQGYNQTVLERGSSLSTGQKQIITFIRALINHPKILILDEATASVDKNTEELIQIATKRMIADRTTIIIAHRLSTIQFANKIMVVDQGEIIEFGTHHELLKLNKHYAKYYYKQLSELDNNEA